jgi:hypothetical protein
MLRAVIPEFAAAFRSALPKYAPATLASPHRGEGVRP